VADIIQVVWCPVCHKYLGHYRVDDELETKRLECGCGSIVPLIA